MRHSYWQRGVKRLYSMLMLILQLFVRIVDLSCQSRAPLLILKLPFLLDIQDGSHP